MTINVDRPEIALIKTLKRLKPEDQKNIVKYLNESAVDLLEECFHNIISTDLRLKKRDKKKLKEKLQGNEKLIRYISKKSNPLEKRRQKLIQSGNSSVFVLYLQQLIKKYYFLCRWFSWYCSGNCTPIFSRVYY